MHPKASVAGLTLLCGALFGTGAAMAADRPEAGLLPPAPPLPALYSWTGAYLGVQAGYSWGQERTRFSDAFGRGFNGARFSQGADTAIGGGQAGFNFQIGGFVIGVEGDVEALDASETLVAPGIAARVGRDWQASLRGRVGFAMDRFMIYATGGAAFTEFDYRVLDPATGLTANSSRSKIGWAAGLGVNFAYTDSLILGAEYRYTDFGKVGHHAFGGPFQGLSVHQETDAHALRASVAYKF